jgi:hypothetical protein
MTVAIYKAMVEILKMRGYEISLTTGALHWQSIFNASWGDIYLPRPQTLDQFRSKFSPAALKVEAMMLLHWHGNIRPVVLPINHTSNTHHCTLLVVDKLVQKRFQRIIQFDSSGERQEFS